MKTAWNFRNMLSLLWLGKWSFFTRIESITTRMFDRTAKFDYYVTLLIIEGKNFSQSYSIRRRL